MAEIYTTLKARKLVKNRHDFMRQYVPGRVRSVYFFPASAITLTRLWTALNAKGQFDLAARAHEALLAAAVPQ